MVFSFVKNAEFSFYIQIPTFGTKIETRVSELTKERGRSMEMTCSAKQLIVVVEGIASMGPYWKTIISDYLEKIIGFD